MSFDEELERTLDALADRLHNDVARQVRAVAAELAAAASAERAALEALEAQEAQKALGALSPAPVEPTVTEPLVDSGPDQLAEGVRTLSLARSLSEVLDSLVNESGRIASRVAVLLVRGDRFQGWRFLGFDLSAEQHRSFDVARDEAGVIGEAADSGAPARAAGAPAFAHLSPDEACIGLPLLIAGETVAVLYADKLQMNAERLEVLALHASKCLESLTAIKAAAALVAPPDATIADADDESAPQDADVRTPAGDVEEKARA